MYIGEFELLYQLYTLEYVDDSDSSLSSQPPDGLAAALKLSTSVETST